VQYQRHSLARQVSLEQRGKYRSIDNSAA